MREQMQAIFGNLFDTIFDESVSDFVGSWRRPGSVDPITEKPTEELVTYNGRGVFYNYDADRVNELNIKTGDVQLIVLINEVSGRPDIGHEINTSEVVPILGVPALGYKVINVIGDPAGVHYDLQLRRP